eukprot:TRINITY_DN64027_c0_g1_i1.p1 TRINITY_DN64027_c0_g1~~TRINITY_DN64027_c0_g1_i1.p1  ORF type:complete len:349 (-),score=83.23 TRINITY_DN64027_c0_g1_i1:19-1029(-)
MARRSLRRDGLLRKVLLLASVTILVPSLLFTSPSQGSRPEPRSLQLQSKDEPLQSRRTSALLGAASLLSATLGEPLEAKAADVSTVVVAGATGQTGRRVVQRLAQMEGVSVIGGVRDVRKAEKALADSSMTIRGAMVEQGVAIDTKGVALKALDVEKDSVDKIASLLQGASSLVIATGFVPGANPFGYGSQAHAVDNVGTVALVDAAKKAGVKKVVMVSSILTDAAAWGQDKSPGYVFTNAFGGVLDEKLVAEKYLRKSGLDFTIVRPGGLKDPTSGNLVFSKENTLADSREVSRDAVADVVVAALRDPKASNKVVEIVQDENSPALAKGDWFASV